MRAYCRVSALTFIVVAAMHLLRVLRGTPVLIGTWQAPMAASWVAVVVAGALAVWAFRLAATSQG